MVQRKVQRKLGIQADHVNFEKRPANLKISSHFQDGKHKGADLKKKMKKSRSIKVSDIESLRSSPLRNSVPSIAAAAAASPQKQQALTKTTYGSPNYMKPTSCSHAKKEQSQVSLQNSLAIFSNGKNLQQRRNSSNSKLSSGSNKPERSLSIRTSGLKVARTLIKSPTFKPARASAKKTSRVALCAADVNAQRATCSSTLKDTKFPDYLMINHGGTEAEGTSVMKVCPYTYCSLNGHHRSPVPPLKCFLSARRRSLKNQKLMKLQALRPHAGYRDGEKEHDFQQMLFDDNGKTAEKEAALDNMNMPAMKHEVGMDIFVEIYVTSKEDAAGSNGRKVAAESVEEQGDYNGHMFPNDASDEADTKKYANNLVVENLSDTSPQSESESEAESFEDLPAEDQQEDTDEDCKPLKDQEETAMGSSSNESDSEDSSSIEVDYANSDSTDMEWEEGQFSADMHEELQGLFEEKTQSLERQHNDDGVQDGTKQNFEIQESGELYERLIYDQLSYTEDAFEDDSELSETDCIEISSSSTEEPIEELTATGQEIQEQNEVIKAEDHEIDSGFGDIGSNCISMETDETSDNQPKNTIQDDKTSAFTGNQISNASRDISKTNDAETNDGCNRTQDKETSETDQNVATGDCGLEEELTEVVAGDQMEERQQFDDAKSSEEIQLSDSAHDTSEADKDAGKVEHHSNCKKTEAFQLNDSAEDGHPGQNIVDQSIFVESNSNFSDGKYKKSKISSPIEYEDQNNLRLNKYGIPEFSTGDDNVELESNSDPDTAETLIRANNSTTPGMKRKFSNAESNSNEEISNTCNFRKGIKCKRLSMDEEEQRKFNPREPNYLPVIPDPEAEKVDLRHQTTDEKKNAEEWMLDFALQQAVTKLAPARKKKVALLVEAFEAVMPVPKYEPRVRHTSTAFGHARPMQACS